MKIFYWTDIKWIIGETLPTKEDFDKDWKAVPLDVGYDDKKSVEGNLSNVFGILNRDGNPLSTEENQKWIRKNLKPHPHTSMSVGDIVKIDDTYHITMSLPSPGWQKLEWK